MTISTAPHSDPHPLAYVEADWRDYLRGHGLSQTHARSLLSAYAGTADIASHRSLALGLRRRLHQDFARFDLPLRICSRHTATDAVVKWGLRTRDDHAIECVYIPQGRRGTACLSSQAGCAYACRFCATASLPLARNLSTSEILAQLHLMRQEVDALGAPAISNVVFMGMGEPLANLRALVPAIELITDDNAYAIAQRRVTVSTVGLADRIVELARECNVNLAVSLHAPDDDLRARLMPINRRWPLRRLIDACRDYARARPGRTITIEYLMLSGVNDSPNCAGKLASLLAGLPVKINLIPFNAGAQTEFVRSAPAVVTAFAVAMRRAGYVTTIRRARGLDAVAACGQLANIDIGAGGGAGVPGAGRGDAAPVPLTRFF